ncbi:MAG: tetratricopeptide repeat protein [Nitrospinae bacterium]|nr:tetratricopeptide repeat protein [Nitrospinota bacterium]
MSSARIIRKAASLAGSGKADDAGAVLSGAAVESPSGRLFIRLGLISKSAEQFRAAVKADTANRAARYFLAANLASAGDWENALKTAEEGLAFSPSNISLGVLRALSKYKLSGDLKYLLEAETMLPAATLRAQALVLCALEERISALATDDKGSAEREHHIGGPFGWIFGGLDGMAAWIHWAAASAMNVMRNLAKPSKMRGDGMVIQADRLYAHGNKADAFELYKKALASDRQNALAAESLAVHCSQNGMPEEAAQYLKRLENILGDSFEHDQFSKLKADIAYAGNRFDEAANLYEAARGQSRLDWIIPYRLGLLNLRGKDRHGAADRFCEALSLINPGLLNERLALLGSLSRKAGG